MSFEVKTLSLSSLSPIRLTYNYNSDERLNCNYRVIDSGLRYYDHDLLSNCADGAFSQQNVIILTKTKDIKEVFEQTTTLLDVQNLACSFLLSVPDTETLNGDVKVKKLDQKFYVGGKGKEAIFNAFPIKRGKIEITVDKKQLAVSSAYPYDLILLDEPLQINLYRQQFLIQPCASGFMLKVKTDSGYRYLSYSKDRVLRCVGLHLNDTIINPYIFTPIFLSNNNIQYDFRPSTNEVRYYNEFSSPLKERTVDIKTQIQVDTNLIVSCSLDDIVDKDNVNVNIAITKTNFSTSGTFNTSL